MWAFVAVVGFCGFPIFLGLTLTSFIKKNDKWKRNAIIMAVFFVLMVIGSTLLRASTDLGMMYSAG